MAQRENILKILPHLTAAHLVFIIVPETRQKIYKATSTVLLIILLALVALFYSHAIPEKQFSLYSVIVIGVGILLGLIWLGDAARLRRRVFSRIKSFALAFEPSTRKRRIKQYELGLCTLKYTKENLKEIEDQNVILTPTERFQQIKKLYEEGTLDQYGLPFYFVDTDEISPDAVNQKRFAKFIDKEKSPALDDKFLKKYVGHLIFGGKPFKLAIAKEDSCTSLAVICYDIEIFRKESLDSDNTDMMIEDARAWINTLLNLLDIPVHKENIAYIHDCTRKLGDAEREHTFIFKFSTIIDGFHIYLHNLGNLCRYCVEDGMPIIGSKHSVNIIHRLDEFLPGKLIGIKPPDALEKISARLSKYPLPYKELVDKNFGNYKLIKEELVYSIGFKSSSFIPLTPHYVYTFRHKDALDLPATSKSLELETHEFRFKTDAYDFVPDLDIIENLRPLIP